MRLFFLGAIAMASLVAALFFLRFWRDTGDRFFLFFAAAFGVEVINRVALGLDTLSEETEPFLYMVRLFSFLLILRSLSAFAREQHEDFLITRPLLKLIQWKQNV